MNKLTSMKLGNEIFKEIPQLEVVAEYGEKTRNFYLSPFRAYGFQVSGTDDGQGSYGVSEFIGLKNIVKSNEERIAKAIFRGMALNALMDHNRHYDKGWYPSFKEVETLDSFVDASYDWVKTLVHEKNEIKKGDSKQSIIEKLKTRLLKEQA